MEIKKIIVGVAAQNCAGKSESIQGAAAFLQAGYYSARTFINKRHKKKYGTQLTKDIDFQVFCESEKKLLGPETFLLDILHECMSENTPSICFIESLRAPGEPLWMRRGFSQRYSDSIAIPIGITAPYEDRLRRFLEGREGEISVRTKEGFDTRESNVNRGTLLWEENVEATLEQTVKRFENPDGALQQTITEIAEYVRRYGKTYGILS